MPSIPDSVQWRRLKKHTWANIKQWDESKPRSSSEDGPAVYDPHLYHTNEEIESLERRCIIEGRPLVETDDFVSCFLEIEGGFVGACDGQFTYFAYAEIYAGRLHGYPISAKLLREKFRIEP